MLSDTMSAAAYNLMIGVVLIWGFAVNWLMVQMIAPEAIASINRWVLFGGYSASCLAGA